jgi:hypothetical protein
MNNYFWRRDSCKENTNVCDSVRSEVLTAVLMKIQVFQDVMWH